MTAEEKHIIETILADIGLEPLFIGENDCDKPERVVKTT